MSRLETLLQLHGQDPDDADLLYMIANEHVAEGRFDDAIPWLERYVDRGRDVGAGWAMLAECHEALGDPETARSALERGIAASLAAGHPTLASELRARMEDEP